MKIENTKRAAEAIRELEASSRTLCRVNYALEPDVAVYILFGYYGRDGHTEYKENIPMSPIDLFEEDAKSQLTKYKKYLECRISALKEEIENL